MNSAVVVPSLGTTIGAAYVGAMLSSLYVDLFNDSVTQRFSSITCTRLFGITVLQVFIYYRDYRNDWQLFRYSVREPFSCVHTSIHIYSSQVGILWYV